MSVLMVRSTIRPEFAADLEQAVRAMFAAIEKAQPTGIRYASYRLADGVTYVAELHLDDGVENPLPAIAEFHQFQAGLKQWLAAPPVVDQLQVIGSYPS